MQREQAVADLKCEAVREHVVAGLPQLEAAPAVQPRVVPLLVTLFPVPVARQSRATCCRCHNLPPGVIHDVTQGQAQAAPVVENAKDCVLHVAAG